MIVLANSMTGYASASVKTGSAAVTVEIKSVNHRFSEITVRMPRHFGFLEDKIKKAVGKYVQRGRVDVFVNVEGDAFVKRSLKLDWNLLNNYHELYRTAKEKMGYAEEISLHQLLSMENVLTVIEEEGDWGECEEMLLTACEMAVKKLLSMREMEGKELIEAVNRCTGQIRAYIYTLKELAPRVAEQYRERLTRKLKEYISGTIDETRILTEAAIFAEKADITEELTRLESHLAQFSETVSLAGPIGRKLDFLVQEMNREINTVGSKANNGEIARLVVEVKSELEKIKEQVQNIE